MTYTYTIETPSYINNDENRYTPKSTISNILHEDSNAEYNCESYAVHDCLIEWIWSDYSIQELLEEGYNKITLNDIKKGDLVCVLDHSILLHYALVSSTDNKNLLNTRVISKWGSFGLWETLIEECTAYGNKFIFLRKQ